MADYMTQEHRDTVQLYEMYKADIVYELCVNPMVGRRTGMDRITMEARSCSIAQLILGSTGNLGPRTCADLSIWAIFVRYYWRDVEVTDQW